MIVDTQEDIIKALSNPKLYPAKWHVQEVTIRQSHIAVVFFVGEYVFKLKRAIVLPDGTDFSTPAKRRLACVHEMRRSTVYAPHLILGVRSVRRLENGRICIGGKAGVEIDTILVMRRINEENILSNILPSPSFDRFQIMDLAEQLADLHSKSKTFYTKWGVESVRQSILQLDQTLSCFDAKLFNRKKLHHLLQESFNLLDKNAPLITMRQKAGCVRKCHGDLLLSNIAYENKSFLFFSPIEYSEMLDRIDTLYDLSFLLMDFEHKGMRRLANMLFNYYMAYMNDISGVPLLKLYQAIRAASRAAVCAKKSTVLEGDEKEKALQNAKEYFELACHYMTHYSPIIIACGGLSGSGKSRVARELGGWLNPAPGAVILRDDVVKKQINGCKITEHFDPFCDTPAVEKVVYDVLRQQTKMAIESGACVIVDALFYDPKERQAIEDLAKELNVPFVGLWMDAPLSVRIERVLARQRNVSDVREQKDVEKQARLETGDVFWHKINTDQTREETVQEAVNMLRTIKTVPLVDAEKGI